MDDERRRVYRRFAYGFIAVGLAVGALALAEGWFGLGLVRVEALPGALFVLLLGVALLMTVRERG